MCVCVFMVNSVFWFQNENEPCFWFQLTTVGSSSLNYQGSSSTYIYRAYRKKDLFKTCMCRLDSISNLFKDTHETFPSNRSIPKRTLTTKNHKNEKKTIFFSKLCCKTITIRPSFGTKYFACRLTASNRSASPDKMNGWSN